MWWKQNLLRPGARSYQHLTGPPWHPTLFPTSRPLLTCQSPSTHLHFPGLMQMRSGFFLSARLFWGPSTCPRGSAVHPPGPAAWTRRGLGTRSRAAHARFVLAVRPSQTEPHGHHAQVCVEPRLRVSWESTGRRRADARRRCVFIYTPTSAERDFQLLHISRSLISGTVPRVTRVLSWGWCAFPWRLGADLFLGFFAVCVSSSVTSLWKDFINRIACLCFNWIWGFYSFYIHSRCKSFIDIWLGANFPQSVACFFIVLTLSFEGQTFDEVRFINTFFAGCFWCCI